MFAQPIHGSSELYEGEEFSNWEEASDFLSELDPEECSFVVFDKPDGNYIQCAGAKRGLTVEARVYQTPKKFTHYRFGQGEPTGKKAVIQCSCGPIEVDESQLLQLHDARILMKRFLEEGSFSDQYVATDISKTFA